MMPLLLLFSWMVVNFRSTLTAETTFYDPKEYFLMNILGLDSEAFHTFIYGQESLTTDENRDQDNDSMEKLDSNNYYLCGGRLSKMPEWFKNRQADSIPAVHVVNASLFFSSSRNKQQEETPQQSADDKVENATSSANGSYNTIVVEPVSNKDIDSDNWCMLVNFFAPQCPFSAALAPNYNALARAFPDLFVAAVDATQNAKLNLIFGVSGTPTILLFQNGRPAARYDRPDYELSSLVDFLVKQTDLIVEENVTLVEDDKFGPLSEVLKESGTDYYLVASWYFIAFCGLYYFLTSSLAARFLETVKRNWREMNEE